MKSPNAIDVYTIFFFFLLIQCEETFGSCIHIWDAVVLLCNGSTNKIRRDSQDFSLPKRRGLLGIPKTDLLLPRQAVAADDLAHLLLLLDLRVALHHVLQGRQVQLQLLREVLWRKVEEGG